jgi:hypothetical protein
MYRRLGQGFTWFSWLSALITLWALGVFLGFLGVKGLGALDLRLFFGEASPWQVLLGMQPAGEGIWPACLPLFWHFPWASAAAFTWRSMLPLFPRGF